jgi:hypothetical protein
MGIVRGARRGLFRHHNHQCFRPVSRQIRHHCGRSRFVSRVLRAFVGRIEHHVRGHHLMDTLPSEVQQAVASGRSWLCPAFAFVPVWTSPYLPLSPASEAANPASWIWRPSFERQRDFNPPEQRTAQHTLPVCRLLAANIFNLFFKRGFSEKCYSFPVGFFFHEEGSPLPAKIF